MNSIIEAQLEYIKCREIAFALKYCEKKGSFPLNPFQVDRKVYSECVKECTNWDENVIQTGFYKSRHPMIGMQINMFNLFT